jgi:hypothetical protein
MIAPETKRQRLEEAAAAYLRRDVGETLLDFCKRIRIGRRTWYDWLGEPWFRERIAEADSLRAQGGGLDSFHEKLEAVTARVTKDALEAPTARERTAAARLVLEAVGIIGGGSRFAPAPRTELEAAEARYDAARAVEVDERTKELAARQADRAEEWAAYEKRCEEFRQRWAGHVDPEGEPREAQGGS